MKRFKNIFIAAVVLTSFSFFTTPASAQSNIIVQLQQPPPYQFRVEHMWKVTLFNPTQTTYKVYLIGRATERSDGRVVEATTAGFNLPPGIKIVNARDLAPLSVKEYNSKYSDVVKNLGAVPSGNYDICVSVFNALDNTLLGEMCVESEVQNLTQVELLQPEEGARFSEQMTVPSTRTGKSLQLVLKEIPEGMDAKLALQVLLKAAYPGIRLPSNTDELPEPDAMKLGSEWSWPLIDGLQDPASFLQALKQAENPWILLDILVQPIRLTSSPDEPDYGSGDLDQIKWTSSTDFGDQWETDYDPIKWTSSTDFGDQWESDYNPIRITSGTDELDYPPRSRSSSSTGWPDEQLDIQPLPGGIMTLSWLPPAPVPPGAIVTYTVRIAQIYGRQSPYDAMYANPSTIKLERIPTNMMQLPVAARRLQPGFYAWKVEVYLNGVRIQESEVRRFSLEPPQGESAKKRRSTTKGTENPEVQHLASRREPVFFASMLTDPEYFRGMPPQGSNLGPSVTPFAFTGSASIEAQYADRVGSFSETPRNYLTADLRPGIMLYGLPFTGNFLYSTLQDANKQSMNSFGINFDFEGMRQGLESRLQQSIAESGNLSSLNTDQLVNIASPSMLTSNLEQHGGITGAEKLFMSIRSLGIGTNYPSYSDHTLSGVPVTGLNLELNPGILYTAFTASRNQRPVDNSAYLRNLYAGRLGVGKQEASHLYFNGLYVSDDNSSIRLDPTNITLTPRENYVFGMEGTLNLFSEHLTLEGEGAMSLLTRDTRDPEFASSAIPSFVRDLTKPRLSSSVDYMYTGRFVYTNMESATKVSAGLKMIGPGYASLGVPNLRTDQFGYEAKYDQRLFNRHVTLGSFFRMYNDNLIEWKSSTTTMTAYGVNLGLNFPRLPYLRVSYSPISQKNDASDPLYKFETNMLMTTVMTGYSYSIGSVNASTSLAYSGQKTEMGIAAGEYKSNSYMIGEMLSFRLPLTLGLNFGMIESQTALGYGVIQTVDVNGSAPLGEIVTLGLGVNLAFERDRNERLGFYMDCALPITQGLDFNLRLEKANYNDFFLTGSTYREFFASAAIVARW
ncbi:MAG: hypothetical protein WAV84_10170 [Bacteroidota bacterium]